MSDVADRDELLLILTAKAREGSVPAAKALLDELRRDADEDEVPGSTLDALDGESNVTPLRRSA